MLSDQTLTLKSSKEQKARPIQTKSDIKRILFDREQLRLYLRIKEARAAVDSYKDRTNSLSQPLQQKTRDLGPLFCSKERKEAIARENVRLVSKITAIETNKAAQCHDPRVLFNMEVPLEQNKFGKIVSRACRTNNVSQGLARNTSISSSRLSSRGKQSLLVAPAGRSLNFEKRLKS